MRPAPARVWPTTSRPQFLIAFTFFLSPYPQRPGCTKWFILLYIVEARAFLRPPPIDFLPITNAPLLPVRLTSDASRGLLGITRVRHNVCLHASSVPASLPRITGFQPVERRYPAVSNGLRRAQSSRTPFEATAQRPPRSQIPTSDLFRIPDPLSPFTLNKRNLAPRSLHLQLAQLHSSARDSRAGARAVAQVFARNDIPNNHLSPRATRDRVFVAPRLAPGPAVTAGAYPPWAVPPPKRLLARLTSHRRSSSWAASLGNRLGAVSFSSL